ncbi:MAG: hypothetical protein IT236_08025 [Bacteroidia bacterium]|nr:hypothetical protein [Bacteroidia bacterium]
MVKIAYVNGLLLIAIFCSSLQLRAQKYIQYDTLLVNEWSFGVAPVLSVLTGGFSQDNNYSSFHFGYNRYFKNKTALRFTGSVYPFKGGNGYEGIVFYDRTVDTLAVVHVDQSVYKSRLQLSVGLEKIYKINRFQHGFGFDAGYFTKTTKVRQLYTWYPKSMPIHSKNRLKYTSDSSAFPGLIYNKVDSLSYSYIQTTNGVSLHLFYSLRHQISKRLYVNANLGSLLFMGVTRRSAYTGAKAPRINGTSYDFEAALLLLDVALSYRF